MMHVETTPTGWDGAKSSSAHLSLYPLVGIFPVCDASIPFVWLINFSVEFSRFHRLPRIHSQWFWSSRVCVCGVCVVFVKRTVYLSDDRVLCAVCTNHTSCIEWTQAEPCISICNVHVGCRYVGIPFTATAATFIDHSGVSSAHCREQNPSEKHLKESNVNLSVF